MPYNQEFMLKKQNELKESLIKSGVFAEGNDLKIDNYDVYKKSFLQSKYEDGTIGGANSDGEEQTLRKLDEIKNYKEQLRHAESSSKLLRGHRINKLREMGNEYGDEVKKNAQAEFIREKVLAHIELLEKNNALPDIGVTDDELLLDALEKRANKFNPLDSRDKEIWKESLAENRELAIAEKNFERRRKYIEENLKPMLFEASGWTLSSEVINNLIKSVSTLPAQLKITQLMEDRVKKTQKENELKDRKKDINDQRGKNQVELENLIEENRNFAGRRRELVAQKAQLERRYLEAKENLRIMQLRVGNKDNMFVDSQRDACEDLYKKITKVNRELNEKDYKIQMIQSMQVDLQGEANEIDAKIESNKQTAEWRATYRVQIQKYIDELEHEKNKSISFERYYYDLARELQLTPRNDARDILLDVMEEWKQRSTERLGYILDGNLENAPEKLILSKEQKKQIAIDLIDDLADGIFVLDQNVIKYSDDIHVVNKFILVGKDRILPREGRHNVLRYNSFFSNLDMGVSDYDLKNLTDALRTREEKMRTEGKTGQEIQKFDDEVQNFINYLRFYQVRQPVRA